MNLAQLLSTLKDDPWLISASEHAAMVQIVEAYIANGTMPSQPDDGDDEDGEDLDANGIATIPVNGTLCKNASQIDKWMGMTDYADISRAINNAVETGAKGILFTYNSNGGQVAGCPELADEIKRLSIPTVAFVDMAACSAAYWLAASSDKIFSSQLGYTGSIGVRVGFTDMTKMKENAGISEQVITNKDASLKIASGALTAAQKEHVQSNIEDIAGVFQKHVQSERPSIDPSAFSGGHYTGERAKTLGLVDGVATEAEAYDKLLKLISNKDARRQRQAAPNGAPFTFQPSASCEGEWNPGEKTQQKKNMTLEELKAQHPDLYAAAKAEAKGDTDGVKTEAAKAERERITALNGMRVEGCADLDKLITEAINGGTEASEIALQAVALLKKENTALAQAKGVTTTKENLHNAAAGLNKVAATDGNAVPSAKAEETESEKQLKAIMTQAAVNAGLIKAE